MNSAVAFLRFRRFTRFASIQATSRGQREQHVSGQSSEAGIAGVNEDHAVDDHGTGPINGAALGFDAVDGLEFSGGVKVPDHLAVLGGITAQVTVHRSGKHDARN